VPSTLDSGESLMRTFDYVYVLDLLCGAFLEDRKERMDERWLGSWSQGLYFYEPEFNPNCVTAGLVPLLKYTHIYVHTQSR